VFEHLRACGWEGKTYGALEAKKALEVELEKLMGDPEKVKRPAPIGDGFLVSWSQQYLTQKRFSHK